MRKPGPPYRTGRVAYRTMNQRVDKREPAALPPVNGQPAVYDSRQLFGTGKEVLIRHGGEIYRLRVTRQNKLILTK